MMNNSQNFIQQLMNAILQHFNKSNTPYKNQELLVNENWLLISYIQTLSSSSNNEMSFLNLQENSRVHDITNLNLSVNREDSDLFEYLLEEELNDLELGCELTEQIETETDSGRGSQNDVSPNNSSDMQYLLEEEEQDEEFTILSLSNDDDQNINNDSWDFTEVNLNLDNNENIEENTGSLLRNFDLTLDLSTILEVEELDVNDFCPPSYSTPRSKIL